MNYYITLLILIILFAGCSASEHIQITGDQDYLFEPELRPNEHILYLDEYFPISMLKVSAKIVLTPKYPAIDVHSHLTLEGDSRLGADDTPRNVIKKMDELGLRAIINLNGGYGETLDRTLEYYSAYPDRIINFVRIDYSNIHDPNYANMQEEFLRSAFEKGARGIKIAKGLGLTVRDNLGNIIPIDDARLDAVWRTAGELGMPVLIHSADPAGFFDPIDENNERIEQLIRRPNWSFYGHEFPDRDEVLKQRDNVILKHPATIFIGAHMGDNAEDLATLANRLDKMPNFFVDMSARVAELGRQPYSSRKFFIKYQDRILFGTDRSPTVVKQQRHQIYYRFLETDDEYFDYYKSPRPPTGSWKIYGIFLPDEVLEKIYYKNAFKLIPDNL